MSSLVSRVMSTLGFGQEEPPEELVCPITLCLMSDPVLAVTDDPDNSHTYERIAIEKVGGVGAECPLTRRKITALVPNRTLKDVLAKWRAGIVPAAAAAAPAASVSPGDKRPAQHSSAAAYPAKRPAAIRVDIDDAARVPIAQAVPLRDDGASAAVDKWQISYRGGILFVEIFALGDKTLVKLHTNSLPLPKDADTNMDASGSMQRGCPAKFGESAGQWTWFDVAAQLQIAQTLSLGNNDRATVRKFATQSEVVAATQTMTAANRESAAESIRASRVGTGRHNKEQTTNLYAAIKSLTLPKKTDVNRHRLCWVACDGHPNETPYKGKEAQYIKQNIAARGQWVPSVHVFSIGADANAMLLHHTAKELGGTFWYISDPSMAGSAGCTAIANFNTVAMTGVHVNGEPIGSLRSGQPRYVLLPSSNQIHLSGDQLGNDPIRIDAVEKKQMAPEHAASVQLRLDVLQYINSLPKTRDPTADNDRGDRPVFVWESTMRQRLVSIVEAHAEQAKAHSFGKALLQDLLPNNTLAQLGIPRDDGREAQIYMALQDAATLGAWGTPYLLAFGQCLDKEMPINDKDATSNYLASLNGQFQQAKGRAMEIYAETPLDLNRHQAAAQAEMDAMMRAQARRRGSVYQPPSRPRVRRNVQTISSNRVLSSGDCILQGSRVAMFDGTTKPVEELCMGDCVQDRHGHAQTVRCLVERTGPREHMYCVGELFVTDNHPVHVMDAEGNEQWQWPRVCGTKIEATVLNTPDFTKRYNVLLEEGDSFVANGVAVIALGHGIVGDSVAEHDYFGDRARVSSALSTLPGWAQGKVRSVGVVRDPETGWITSHAAPETVLDEESGTIVSVHCDLYLSSIEYDKITAVLNTFFAGKIAVQHIGNNFFWLGTDTVAARILCGNSAAAHKARASPVWFKMPSGNTKAAPDIIADPQNKKSADYY